MSVEIQLHTQHIVSTIEDGIDKGLEDLEGFLLNYARANHRYQNRTGNLTGLTKIQTFNNHLNLYNEASYATFIENAPFNDKWLEKTISENLDHIVEVLERNIKNVL